MNLTVFRNEYHEEYLKVRSCNYIIQGPEIEFLFKILKPNDYLEFKTVMYSFDKDKIRKYIQSKKPFNKMTIKQLRSIGKNLQIEDYHRLCKTTLLKEINNVIQGLEENT